MIEIRGRAEALPTGGKVFGDNFEDAIVRIYPERIVSFGIAGKQFGARSV